MNHPQTIEELTRMLLLNVLLEEIQSKMNRWLKRPYTIVAHIQKRAILTWIALHGYSGKASKIKEKRHPNGYLTKTALFEVSKTWKDVSESQVNITTGLRDRD